MSIVLGVSLSVGQNEAILKQNCVSQSYIQIIKTMDSKEMGISPGISPISPGEKEKLSTRGWACLPEGDITQF